MMDVRRLHPSQRDPENDGLPRAFPIHQVTVSGIDMLVRWYALPTGGTKRAYLQDNQGRTYTMVYSNKPGKRIVLDDAGGFIGFVFTVGDYVDEWVDAYAESEQ